MKQPDQVVWPVLALATLFSGVAVGGDLKGPTGACEAGGTLRMTYSAGFGPKIEAKAKVTSSNTAAATVPAEISIRSNQNTTFDVTCRVVTAQTVVTISVDEMADSAKVKPETATIVVNPPPSGASETLGPRVNEGGTITGRVVIFRVADIGGVEVTFATSPPGYLEIPAVRVAGGQARTEAEFRVKGKRAQRNTSVTITAATPSGLPGAKTATVEVLAPPEPVSFVATPTGGRVTLSRAVFVPSTLTLTTRPAGLASVPATVVVRMGESSADVAVTAIPPVPVEPTEITVVAQGPTASAELKTSVAWNGTITMVDSTKPGPPYTVIAGTTKRFSMRANPPVRTPLRIDLSTAVPALRVPASVTIDPARNNAAVDFDITAQSGAARDVGDVLATAKGKRGGAQIIVDPPR